MKTIYKYELKETETQTLNVPKTWEPLHVAAQGNTMCIWAYVESDADHIKVRIDCVWTGQPLPGGVEWTDHIGTVVRGQSVQHFFATSYR